jgi:hypothetical protein
MGNGRGSWPAGAGSMETGAGRGRPGRGRGWRRVCAPPLARTEDKRSRKARPPISPAPIPEAEGAWDTCSEGCSEESLVGGGEARRPGGDCQSLHFSQFPSCVCVTPAPVHSHQHHLYKSKSDAASLLLRGLPSCLCSPNPARFRSVQ